MQKKHLILVRIGQNIRRERCKMGWSQESLAHNCGVHRTYIGAVERGEYNVTILTLKRIARTLQIPLIKLIEEIE